MVHKSTKPTDIDQMQADRDDALIGVVPEPDDCGVLRAALEEAHYGINDYLQEYGESDGKLTAILREIDHALGRHKDG
jgi:hypothetical protein